MKRPEQRPRRSLTSFALALSTILGTLLIIALLRPGPRLDNNYLARLPPELAKYIVRCAYERGYSIRISSTEKILDGYYGLAPYSRYLNLSTKERRWISACLLSLTNLTGAHVPVWLNGPNRQLKATARNPLEYSETEGAFFGDVFSKPQKKYSCTSSTSTPNHLQDIHSRTCSIAETNNFSKCGFQVLGACESLCKKEEKNNFYTGCETPDNEIYNEVITVQLKKE